jgi:hypothetical protein
LTNRETNIATLEQPRIGESLDTLEITSDFDLTSQGTQRKKLIKRARSKHFTNSYTLALIDQKSPLEKKYWDTWHCSSVVRETETGNYYSTYCKNKWCTTCNRIRTAHLLNKYVPVLETWKELHLVTLSRVNVKGDELRNELGALVKMFQKVKDNLRKNYNIKLKGTRNTETTYNPKTDTYHPHFHMVIEGEVEAHLLEKLWIETNVKDGFKVDPKAQDVRKVGTKASDLIEAFKYSNKIVNTVTIDGKKERVIYAHAFDIINQANKGKRNFQNFGFKLPSIENEPETLDEIIKDIEEIDELPPRSENMFVWFKEAHDWLNPDTGELLTGYEVNEAMQTLINGIKRKPPNNEST